MISIHPLKDNNGELIDYVYGYIGSNIVIKAFKGKDRVEESTKAMFELETLQNNNN